MPGRQAHGRPLLGGKSDAAKSRKLQRGKAGSRASALDAFAIAAKDVPSSSGIRGPRARDLDFEPNQRKRHRGDDRDGDENEDEDRNQTGGTGGNRLRNKRARNNKDDGGEDDDSEYGSDSEGNEWRIGHVDEENDSEIDSDEAFGESDEEKFEGFTFRGSSSSNGSKKKKKKKDARDQGEEEGHSDDEDEDGDDDGLSLGEDAIDLAQALDQVSDDDGDGGSTGDTESGSEEDGDSDSASESAPLEVDSEDDGDDENDPSKLDALQNLVAGFSGGGGSDEDAALATSTAGAKAKVGLEDLALSGVKDPNIKKSLRLLQKEGKAVTAIGGKNMGGSQKLGVPLARRQQARLDRIAASEQANKTLDRWQDTVKHNRRAEHLVFPLANTLPDAGLQKDELVPLNPKAPSNELEQTIMSIMEESGLGPSSKPQTKLEDEPGDSEQQQISRAQLQELWSNRRREREKKSREQARAARIKKIKSKAYRRVHRKERERIAANEEMLEEGEGGANSEEEREAQHRRRALERVGAKHRDSKWARSAKKAGLAAWDEGVRTGLAEMARRDEDLRRRVEGRGTTRGDDEEDEEEVSNAGSGSDDEREARQKLLRELDEAVLDRDDVPESNIMKMKFMQRAEAARKQANDALIAELRRELDSDFEGDDGEDEDRETEPAEIGRRSYGVPGAIANGDTKAKMKASSAKTEANGVISLQRDSIGVQQSVSDPNPPNSLEKPGQASASSRSAWPSGDKNAGIAGSWSRGGGRAGEAGGPKRKEKKIKGAGGDAGVVDLSVNALATSAPLTKPNKKAAKSEAASSSQQQQQQGNNARITGSAHTGKEREGELDSDSDAEAALHLPLAIRDRELAERAFAGEDLLASTFEQEKAAIAEEDDDKVVDDTLPGWGSWGGEGVSNRQKKMQQGRFLRKVEGVKKKKDRKDAKLEKVIINERRVRKNDKYLASQLPHVFENKDQYERSLRLPVGPEWTTKQTFQDATKPRILLKQGIIAPMLKPMAP